MKEPFYVYVAGPITGLPSEYLANVAAITYVSRRLMEAGYCPINTAADMLEGLMDPEPLPLERYQDRALALLSLLAGRPRAALYVINTTRADGSLSLGVQAEVVRAEDLGIPVVCTRTELDRMKLAPDRKEEQ